MDQSALLTTFLLLDVVFVAGWITWRWRAARTPRVPALPPAPLPPPPRLPVDRFYFSAEDATLPGDAGDEAELLATYLKSYNAEVMLEGSADASGNLTTNRRLAKARAEAVRRTLTAKGVDAGSLTVTAVEPLPGRTEADRQRLRCVRVILKS